MIAIPIETKKSIIFEDCTRMVIKEWIMKTDDVTKYV